MHLRRLRPVITQRVAYQRKTWGKKPPELIFGGVTEDDVVDVDQITTAEDLNDSQLTENDDVERCKGKESREPEDDPQFHRMGSTPERKPRAAFYHTKAGSVNDNLLSRRTHCRYVFRGCGKSLEDATKLDYRPLQLSIVRETMPSHYELYKIAGIFRSGTIPSCL